MIILEKFGNRIVIQREKLGLTQMDLASLCGVSDLTIRNIERGKSGTSIGNWLNVADKLGMKLDLNIKTMNDEVGRVFNNKIEAGTIIELTDRSFEFKYDSNYLLNGNLPAICLNMPKRIEPYKNQTLFPFFYNLLSEGANKKMQSIQLKIDEEDAFGFLLKTTVHETIGAIRVEEIIES